MNDWQRVYNLTESVTPSALLTVTRLRLALALGKVTADQVQEALAGGAEGVDELLEATEPADAHERFEEFHESVDDSFDAFGRLV